MESEILPRLLSGSNLARGRGSAGGALRLCLWSPASEAGNVGMAAFLAALPGSTLRAGTRFPLYGTDDARALAQGSPVTQVWWHSAVASSSVTVDSGPGMVGGRHMRAAASVLSSVSQASSTILLSQRTPPPAAPTPSVVSITDGCSLPALQAG